MSAPLRRALGRVGTLRIALYFSLFGLLLAVAAGAGVWYARSTAEAYARSDAFEDASFAARSAAAQIDESLSALREQITTTAASPAVAAAIATPEGCTLTFTGVGPASSGHLDFLGPDGSLRCTSMPRADGDYIDAPWLDGVAGYTLVGPMIDEATGRSVLVSVTPVGDAVGYVVVFIDLDSLGPGLGAQFAGRRNLEIVVVTSGADHIVTRSIAAAQWTGASVGSTPFAASVDAEVQTDVAGVDRIYGHSLAQSQDWHVYAGADQAAALATARDSFVRALIIVLVALGAMLTILVVVYHRIAGPIRALSRSVRSQATDPTHRIVVRGPTEVVHVAEEFNALVQNLQRELVDRQAAEASALEAERTYRMMFENNPQPMWIWEHETMSFLAVNDAAIAHYGYSRDEFLSMRLPDILPSNEVTHDASNSSELIALNDLAEDPLHMSGPWRHVTQSGNVIAVDITSHSLSFYGRRARFAMITDVTRRLEHEAQLRHLALHDELTGLPNRTLALERLGSIIAHAPAARTTLGVLYMDLDRFKLINDVHGHANGNRLLLELAERLTATFRNVDTIARSSGNSFAILCPDLTGETEAISMAGRIEGLLASSFNIGDSEVFLTASVGISLFAGADHADELMRNAEAAMYRAKQRGGNRYEIFDDAIRSRTLLKLETSNELRRAIDRDELRVHYQPEIDLRDGSCTGAEALVRWQHPSRGLLAPEHFVALAEEDGFIVQLGAWVLRTACHQAALWRATGNGPTSVSVNLSARELAEPTLVGQVSAALDQSALDPSALCLEITETSLVEDPDGAASVLASLRHLGVQLSIDDFGTGYSSLLYLRRYPVDFLKIDRSFVNGLGRDHQDTAIIASIIDLAHAFDIAVVAEGVETSAQATQLTEMGCDLGQGYFWSRPLPADEVAQRTHELERDMVVADHR